MGARMLLFAVVAALAAAGGAHAQSGAIDLIRLDASRSDGAFRVKLMWLLGIDGAFGHIDGDARVDRDRDVLRVAASIDASTLRMCSRRYENWAKSEDFFDVAHHPLIVFVSDEFARARLADGGELPGRLTVRGISRPVRFALLPAACERPAYDCPIRVRGTIRRSQFGMDAHRGTLADKVELDFRVYARPGPATLSPR